MEVAHAVGPRLGLTDEETETVAWLVRWHLLMSNTAFKRDIHDPQTVRDFVEIVQSPERLRLLLCLTVADIRAVGPNIWNNWKATLLRELYYRAEEVLSGGAARATAPQRASRRRRRRCARSWPTGREDDIAAQFARGYPAYWLSVDTPDAGAPRPLHAPGRARRGAHLARHPHRPRARRQRDHDLHRRPSRACSAASPARMALAGANIVDAQIFTMSNGMALDTFMIQEALTSDRTSTAFERPERLAKLAALIEQVLSGRLRLRDALAKRTAPPLRMAAFTAPPRVVIDNKASATHTLIEINGADRPGLLFNVTNALTELGLSIGTAKIATYGERVVDVFYVKDVFGHKIDEERKLARIRERVLAALADPNAKARPAPTVRRRRAGAAAAE